MKAKFGLFASVIFIVVTLLFSAFGNGTGPVMLETDVLSLQQGATIHGMNLARTGHRFLRNLSLMQPAIRSPTTCLCGHSIMAGDLLEWILPSRNSSLT